MVPINSVVVGASVVVLLVVMTVVSCVDGIGEVLVSGGTVVGDTSVVVGSEVAFGSGDEPRCLVVF